MKSLNLILALLLVITCIQCQEQQYSVNASENTNTSAQPSEKYVPNLRTKTANTSTNKTNNSVHNISEIDQYLLDEQNSKEEDCLLNQIDICSSKQDDYKNCARAFNKQFTCVRQSCENAKGNTKLEVTKNCYENLCPSSNIDVQNANKQVYECMNSSLLALGISLISLLMFI